MTDDARTITSLADRGVVSVSGPDALALLQSIATNDLEGIAVGEARFAGLLTPQGKILFEFFVIRTDQCMMLETARVRISDLVKRLTMYKLRAKADIRDVSDRYRVLAGWGGAHPNVDGVIAFQDPRHADMGWRCLMPATARELSVAQEDPANYDARRVSLGVAEGDKDYPIGDTFPHEADWDLLQGVSFTKGCFVGQEVVARMQHKTVVRKRAVRISADTALSPGSDITVGEAVIGKIGTVAGNAAIAQVRLDRIDEALEKGQPVEAGGVAISVDPEQLRAYRRALSERKAGTL